MSLRNAFTSAVLLVVLASAASAYTIVMRNGRHVEIPDNFTISHSTLTYEVSSGIQVTIQLAGIDIAATERANGQARGSFMQRAAAAPSDPVPVQTQRSAAGRSITNKDLESYRQRRVQSELAYEKRRRELNLPSLEAYRSEAAAIQEATRQQLLNRRAENQDTEEYWRSRARELRTEIASNQAQVEYVRGRLEELPSPNSIGALSTTNPFGYYGNGFPYQYSTSTVYSGSNISVARTPFPGLFPDRRSNRYYRGGRYSPYGRGNVLVAPFQSYDYSYERAELSNQLNQLEMQRAGLGVRWREFEEEARRAGAYPGWLRP
jgi:hypothetical protein